MRSFKRTFLAGLVLFIVFVLIFGWLQSLEKFPEQLKKLLFQITRYQIPYLEYVIAIIIIFLLGVIAQKLSRREPSKFSLINMVLGVPKTINKIIHKMEKGEIDVVRVKIAEDVYFLGLTANEIVKTDEGEMVSVFRPSTPNLSAGYTILIPKGKVVCLPELKGQAFKILFHGWIG